jgi:hypothetical protein
MRITENNFLPENQRSKTFKKSIIFPPVLFGSQIVGGFFCIQLFVCLLFISNQLFHQSYLTAY